jgi:small-conductance mechanosensitive channel
MKTRLWILVILFLLLAGGTTAGFILTREASAAAEEAATKPKKAGSPPRERRVDQRPLLTARRLALLARTPEELALSKQAERLANHDVDLAFAEAMRQAVESVPPPTPELKALQTEKAKAEAAVEEEEKNLKRLNGLLPEAKGAAQDRLEDQIEIAKAQLELDRDELEEAAENLERAGGDPQAQIRRLKAAQEAAEQEATEAVSANPAAPSLPAHSLLARFREWNGQRVKRGQLLQAQQDAQTKLQRMIQRQQALSQKLQEDKEARAEIKQQASKLSRSASASKEESETARESIRYFTQEQRRLTALVKRSQDQRQLGEVYGAWISLVEGYQRTALHSLLKTMLTIFGVLASVFLLNRVAELLIAGRSKENLRAGTHRTVVKILTRGLGLVIIIFVIVGLPAQTSTVLGLTGAGLTVALKDYIVAFFGWFMLMGKNGIRVGDWVEIKGVGGEVVEVGLLRTVILETGSWSDSGHPTGRRVAFVNSFAMEGHYFNFSTTGQWMWDELKVLLPAGQDPYPILEGVQKLVEAETRANADLAEQEWRKTTSRYRVRAFSTTPGIQVVPTAQGVEIHARYITRAFQRHETRRNLYQAVIELMHGKPVEPPQEA